MVLDRVHPSVISLDDSHPVQVESFRIGDFPTLVRTRILQIDGFAQNAPTRSVSRPALQTSVFPAQALLRFHHSALLASSRQLDALPYWLGVTSDSWDETQKRCCSYVCEQKWKPFADAMEVSLNAASSLPKFAVFFSHRCLPIFLSTFPNSTPFASDLFHCLSCCCLAITPICLTNGLQKKSEKCYYWPSVLPTFDHRQTLGSVWQLSWERA